MTSQPPPLPWLGPSQDFPPTSHSWGKSSPAPGLLAAGGKLDIETLRRAYSRGIFPWYSEGQSTLWWSPNPRMVLHVSEFRLHTSLKKTLQKFRHRLDCEIRIDSAFEEVIRACATSPRSRQAGTWIVPEMMTAYEDLHRAGLAHSMETWVHGRLAGGLYFVAIGKSVFGESMFTRMPDASKIALAALVGICRHHAIAQIDCQQYTRHLASLGAREISRELFEHQVTAGITQEGPIWQFDPRYWNDLPPPKAPPT